MKENCIAIQPGVLQEVADLVKGFVLQQVSLYCNRRGLAAGSSVLQYTALYCSLGVQLGRTYIKVH